MGWDSQQAKGHSQGRESQRAHIRKYDKRSKKLEQ